MQLAVGFCRWRVFTLDEMLTLSQAHYNCAAADHYTAIRTWLVHWPLMGGLLHLVQRGGAWAGCGSAQFLPRCSCTKYNSPPISGQCTNFIQKKLVDVPIKWLTVAALENWTSSLPVTWPFTVLCSWLTQAPTKVHIAPVYRRKQIASKLFASSIVQLWFTAAVNRVLLLYVWLKKYTSASDFQT